MSLMASVGTGGKTRLGIVPSENPDGAPPRHFVELLAGGGKDVGGVVILLGGSSEYPVERCRSWGCGWWGPQSGVGLSWKPCQPLRTRQASEGTSISGLRN